VLSQQLRGHPHFATMCSLQSGQCSCLLLDGAVLHAVRSMEKPVLLRPQRELTSKHLKAMLQHADLKLP